MPPRSAKRSLHVYRPFGVGALFVAIVPWTAWGAADASKGERIYQDRCASCHGKSGEGVVDEYPRPLEGDRSVAQLEKLIAKTMPSDAPGTCVGPDAESVASYVHAAFYSPTARARNAPPRVELARLTVSQYRNVATDLVASFRGDGEPDARHGLQAEYYKTRQMRREQRTIERIDPEVAFDFGEGRPPGEKLDPAAEKAAADKERAEIEAEDKTLAELDQAARDDRAKREAEAAKAKAEGKEQPPDEKEKRRNEAREKGRKARERREEIAKKKEERKNRQKEFSIRWQGSVFAPETGDYEFIVRTENAAKLWVNDLRKPLIDASVKSGNDTEYRGSTWLLGGRTYAIKLEFHRGLEPKGSVALEWKPPRGVASLIPRHDLSPAAPPERFVLTTPFPPDDRSVGYERGSSVSAAWEQATTDAAIELANYIGAKSRDFTGVMPSSPDREARFREFAWKFAERAFRRPLTDQEIYRYIDRQFDSSPDLDTALKRSVLVALKSPKFLYREVGGNDPYDVASRVSFDLWDSIPDKTLLYAASANELDTHDRVARQAARMVNDQRTRAKVREFLFQWLKVEPAPDILKDRDKIPGFDPQIVADLRTSLGLFIDDAVWGESSDFRQLLLADTTYVNGRLAKFYGANLSSDAPFQKVSLDPGERAGILSHPYLMATFAYSSTTSPIHRGVFLARNVLGRSLRPPPEAVTPLSPDLHAGLSNRERVTLQTSPAACQTCHAMINPLGFTLERFDAVGRLRAMENDKPIDASGSYQLRSGDSISFTGARDLASFLARSDETQAAFIEHIFHHTVKQPVAAYGKKEMPGLRESFASNGYDIRKLLVEIVATTALVPRDATTKILADSGP